MMATTHAFVGLVLAAAVATVAPQFAPAAAAGAILGGLFPDLDLVGAHRKTLHFPVYYWLLAIPATIAAVAAPTAVTLAVALFALTAAIHSVTDLFGGGLEPRPWLGTADRAVYSHYHGRWFAPRRWIGYDGSPGDLALAAALALPALVVFDGVVRTIVAGMLAISIGYAVVRKPLADASEWLADRLPAPLVAASGSLLSAEGGEEDATAEPSELERSGD
ncbi:metal-dependent hydrolase [Halopiger thermotolerans]